MLTVSAIAGNMTTMVTDPPPPPASAEVSSQMTTEIAGDMPINNTDPVTDLALNLLHSLFTLF
jgi:hypothetical protein